MCACVFADGLDGLAAAADDAADVRCRHQHSVLHLHHPLHLHITPFHSTHALLKQRYTEQDITTRCNDKFSRVLHVMSKHLFAVREAAMCAIASLIAESSTHGNSFTVQMPWQSITCLKGETAMLFQIQGVKADA